MKYLLRLIACLWMSISVASAYTVEIDVAKQLYAGWTDSPSPGAVPANDAVNIPDGAGGSFTIGWYQNTAPPTTGQIMGGWGFPDDGNARGYYFPRGYSWDGTHDSGWGGGVGFEATSTGYGDGFYLSARSNGPPSGGSGPTIVWTSGVAGTATITFSKSASAALTALGIRKPDGTWVGDDFTGAPAGDAVARTETATSVTLAIGDQVHFAFRGGDWTGHRVGASITIATNDIAAIDVGKWLYDGWTDSNQGDATTISDGHGGSFLVGWLQGGELPTPGNNNIMGGWGYPDTETSRTLGFPRGYSWNGTHDSGWAAQVGFETRSDARINHRSNATYNNNGSTPCIKWTAGLAGNARFKLFKGDTRSTFGIYDAQTASWTGDNMSDTSAIPDPGWLPEQITMSKHVNVGDVFYFAVAGEGGQFWPQILIDTNVVNDAKHWTAFE